MKDLNLIQPAEGAVRDRKRRGRGIGSGLGRTAGRGTKGWHSRSGSKRPAWYEGGQMPLIRRIPKRGFSNALFRREYQIVKLDSLAALKTRKIDPDLMHKRGLIKNTRLPVKVLGEGELSTPAEISAHKFSRSASEKIEQAGGKTIVLDWK
jgi:large subunit ribosomal protein L15